MEHLHPTVKKNYEKLPYKARTVASCLINGNYGDAYLNDKIGNLQKLDDDWQTIFWATHGLGESEIEQYAKKIGVSVSELETAFRVIRKIDSAGE